MKKRTFVCFLIFTLCVFHSSLPGPVFGQDASLAKQVLEKYRATLTREDIQAVLPDVLKGLKAPNIQNLLTPAIIKAAAANPELLAFVGVEQPFIDLLKTDAELQVMFNDAQVQTLLQDPAAIDELAAALNVGEPPVAMPSLAEQVFAKYRATLQRADIQAVLPDVLRGLKAPNIQNLLTPAIIKAAAANPELLAFAGVEQPFIDLLKTDAELQVMFNDAQVQALLQDPAAIDELAALLNVGEPPLVVPRVEPPVVVEPPAQPLYWINTRNRRLYRIAGSTVKNIVPSVQNATSITVDAVRSKVYWTEKTGAQRGRIRRANLNGSNVELVKALTSVPRDLAIDSAGSKLYLTNAWGKIQRLNFNGTAFQPNLITGLESPQHLALDVAGGKVYWTEPDSLWRANLNGKNREKLIADLGEIGSIAVAGNKVYWTEKNKVGGKRGTIRRAALNGSNVQTLATLWSIPIGITVDRVGHHLYWTNSNGRIQRATLAGQHLQNLVTGLGMPADIALGIAPSAAAVAAAPAPVAVLPNTTVLLANYPNPFNPETWLPYQLAVPAEVTVTIYAANGAVVRTLSLGHQSAGHYESKSRAAYWDGRNAQGEPVASGVYFYTLQAGDFTATQKMVIRQ